MAGAYYNECDPYAAQWLRNLIAAGHIAPGDVDERSIKEVQADDLQHYTQCHFFAGIGVWSHALRRAGWADDRPVWTGSCPCQPFSAAGKQQRFDDDRHLWPAWFNLIRQCRPAIVVGEQVASALDWLDLVSADMEAEGYAFGASDLCAAGFGGAHIRQRLYFAGVANRVHSGLEGHAGDVDHGDQSRWVCPNPLGSVAEAGRAGGLANAASEQHDGRGSAGPGRRIEHPDSSAASGLGDAESVRGQGTYTGSVGGEERSVDCQAWEGNGEAHRTSGSNGRLADADSLGAERERGNYAKASGLPAEKCEPKDGTDVPERGGADRGGCGDGRSDGVSDHAHRPHAPLLGREAADWFFCRDGKWRPVEPGASGGVADPESAGWSVCDTQNKWSSDAQGDTPANASGGATDGQQRPAGQRTHAPLLGRDAADWLYCRDGKWRPVEPGTFPLADAPAARVGRLRAYGNALDAETAAQFCEAVMECLP